MKKIALYLGTLVVLVLLLVTSFTLFHGGRTPVHAQTGGCPVTADTDCLDGWGWSSNTGWLSFNSTDDTGTTAKYDVSIDPTTGDLGQSTDVGGRYAWSSNVGWISFYQSDIASCNNNSGTVANINGATGAVTGWMRVVSEIGRSDGWDGCIELSGVNHPTAVDFQGNQGVTYSSSTSGLLGYAWGGNVMGWLQFSPTLPGGTIIQTKCEPSCPPGEPVNSDLTLTATANNNTYVAPDNGTAVVPLTETSLNGTVQATINWSYDPTVITEVTPTGSLAGLITLGSNGVGTYTVTYANNTLLVGGKTDKLIFTYYVTNGRAQGNSLTKEVDITVTPYQPTQNSCVTPSHAVLCGSADYGPATTVPQCQNPAPECQFQCQAGYKAQNGQCVKSTIQEL